MKKSIQIALLIFSITFTNYAQEVAPVHNNPFNHEADPDFKKQRDSWIEDMHLTEPGINWKLIESVNRQSKQSFMQKKIKAMINQGKSESDIMQESTVANGLLSGSWIEKGSNNLAGRMHLGEIDWDRNLIIAASSGGNIWKGNLDGTDWTCLNNSMQIGNIRAVFTKKYNGKSRIVVVGNGPSGSYYTENDGLTWTKAKGFENAANWGSLHRAVLIDGTNTIYVLANEWDYKAWKGITSIYKSTDFGGNFELVLSTLTGVGSCDIYAPKYGTSDLFYAHSDTLSTINSNNDVTDISNFSSIPEFKKSSNIIMKGSSDANSGYLKIMLNIGDGKSYFYSSSDAGKNWTAKGSLDFGPFERNSFAVSNFDPDAMFFGGVDTYRSEDGGSTWTKVNGWEEHYSNPKGKLHADIPSIKCFKTPKGEELILIGTDGGLYRSDDYTYTVNNLSLKGLNVSQYYSSYTYQNENGIVFAGSQDQGFQRCLNDSGKTIGFQQTISGDYGHLASSDGGDHLWSVYPGFVMLYVNANIDKFNSYYWNLNDNACKNWLWMPPIIGDPSNGQGAYIAAGGINCSNTSNCSYVFHLIFDGSKISHTILPFNFGDDGSRLSAMAFSEINKNYFYALTSNGNFYYSVSKGDSWEKSENLKGPEAHYFYGSSIVASKRKLGKVIIAGSGYSNPGAFVSYDHGMNFAKIDSGLPKTLIYKIAVSDDEKYIFAATEAGPYVYIEDQKQWFSMDAPNSPDQTFWSVEYVSALKTARFVTYGRGIWDFKLEDPAGVKEIIEPVQSLKISAFPNPVVNKTKIRISVTNDTEASVVIYDLEGRIVKSLHNGFLKIGELEFIWDGKNENNEPLASGSYLCVITADGKSDFVNLKLKH